MATPRPCANGAGEPVACVARRKTARLRETATESGASRETKGAVRIATMRASENLAPTQTA